MTFGASTSYNHRDIVSLSVLMAETKKLGDMLKEAGLIDEFQLQSALLTSLHQNANATGKMEIIRGSDLKMPKDVESDTSSPILSKDDAAQQAMINSMQNGKKRDSV